MADDIVTKTKTYTDKVRTAMYGKEVRSSIADSIDKIAENVKDEIARDELSNDVNKLKNDVNLINDDLNNLFPLKDNKNLFNSATSVAGHYIWTNGAKDGVGDNSAFNYATFNVKSGENYILTCDAGLQEDILCFFNSTTVDWPFAIKGYRIEQNVNSYNITIPDGAIKMTISYLSRKPNISLVSDNRYINKKNVDIDMLKKEMYPIDLKDTSFFDYEDKRNLIGSGVTVENYYVYHADGNPGVLADWNYEIIRTAELEYYKINCPDTNDLQISFFKSTVIVSNNSVGSGIIIKNNESFKVPAGAKYLTVSYPAKSKSDITLTKLYTGKPRIKPAYIKDDYITIDKNGNGKYTSILKALKTEGVRTKFKILPGTYDIEQEYKDYYGDDYFEKYTGYLEYKDMFDTGLWLGECVEVYGIGDVILEFNYNGNNKNVLSYFSVINLNVNSVLDNVTIKVGNNNCRYHIHDDFSFDCDGKNVIRNCSFYGCSHNKTAIGGGMGRHMTYTVENNDFHCDTENNISVSYHNSTEANVSNKLYVRNNYCEGKIRVMPYGASTNITLAIVCNNYATQVTYEKGDATIDNIKLIAFNNTTTLNNTQN